MKSARLSKRVLASAAPRVEADRVNYLTFDFSCPSTGKGAVTMQAKKGASLKEALLRWLEQPL